MRIITDSTSDIDEKQAKELQIDVVPLKIIINGQEYKDRIDLQPDEFYKLLEESEPLPTTSQPSPQDFLNYYQPAIDNKEPILVITLSSKISGTYQSAHIAKELAEYENIHIIDSMNTTLGLKLLVLKAIELRDCQLNIEDMISTLEDYKQRIKIFALVDTLEYFYKGGRLSKTATAAGTLLKLKPIVGLNNGTIGLFSKARGLTKGTKKIIEIINDFGGLDETQPVCIGYTGAPNELEKFEQTLQDAFHFESTYHTCVGPVVGTHVGPNAKAIAYIQKENSK